MSGRLQFAGLAALREQAAQRRDSEQRRDEQSQQLRRPAAQLSRNDSHARNVRPADRSTQIAPRAQDLPVTTPLSLRQTAAPAVNVPATSQDLEASGSHERVADAPELGPHTRPSVSVHATTNPDATWSFDTLPPISALPGSVQAVSPPALPIREVSGSYGHAADGFDGEVITSPVPGSTDDRYEKWSKERILAGEKAYARCFHKRIVADVGCAEQLRQFTLELLRWRRINGDKKLSLLDKHDLKALRDLGNIYPGPCIAELGSKMLGRLACEVIEPILWRYKTPSPLPEECMWFTRFAEDHIVNYLYSDLTTDLFNFIPAAPEIPESDVYGFAFQEGGEVKWHLFGAKRGAMPFDNKREAPEIDTSLRTLSLRPKIHPVHHDALSRLVSVPCDAIVVHYLARKPKNVVVAVTLFHRDSQETIPLPDFLEQSMADLPDLVSRPMEYDIYLVTLLTTRYGRMVVYSVTGKGAKSKVERSFFDEHPEWDDGVYPDALICNLSREPMQEPVLILEHSYQMYDKASVDHFMASNAGILRHPIDRKPVLSGYTEMVTLKAMAKAGHEEFLGRMKAEAKVKELQKELERLRSSAA
ncbi:hypothetical protein QM012_006226 [Aureobasidium pullulans]|uniref:Uncharacterized protein n=1 Tax=Aureobasidium pullulans TaxID=5580 RepID=A0ABR0TRY6_AURPU